MEDEKTQPPLRPMQQWCDGKAVAAHHMHQHDIKRHDREPPLMEVEKPQAPSLCNAAVLQHQQYSTACQAVQIGVCYQSEEPVS